MEKIVQYINNNKLGVVYLNKKFKDITTIKIGGNIKLLFYPYSIQYFIDFYIYYLKYYKNKYPLIVIGNGSNILASSNKYEGIVVCFKKITFKYFLYNNKIIVNSGVMINDLILFLKNNNKYGLEKLYYIPATIGGLIKMNGGAYDYNISDDLILIKTINKEGNIKIYKKQHLIFKYRYCSLLEDEIILEAIFNIKNNKIFNLDNILQKIKTNRLLKQPYNYYNAGSTFINPEGMSCWKMIDDIGLRGYCINEACVSKKHCNFLINKGGSNSDDMLELITKIKIEIYNKYNINLQCEWILINF